MRRGAVGMPTPAERAAGDVVPLSRLAEAWRVQQRVVGALILRELHVRFGRRNLGYLWLFAEPLLLGLAISTVHALKDRGASPKSALSVFAFFAIGYSLYYMFRAVVGRAASGLAGSRPLLYHRIVTPLDMLFARHLLEGAACVIVVILMSFAVAVVEGLVPADPMKMLAAVLLMLWMCHGLALLVAAGAERWEVVDRLTHPLIYLQLPISGAFFLVDWLPHGLQELALYNPTVHIFELLRDGQFGERIRTTYDIAYVAVCSVAFQLLGLCAIRAVRPHMMME
ncbi:transport permease protein [Caldovatus sediminis]|uniref:Transport permease protein n=2 Tax=Caldovatus sediminis TaxID=2041189 RepID=A0A8J3ECC4_9PROT|nr:transport permease protein [Caldovatus sediminis]